MDALEAAVEALPVGVIVAGPAGALDRVNARLKNIKFQTTAGPHKIGVTFKRRTFAESDDQLQQFAPGGGQDRFYRIPSFQLQGPFNAKGLSSTPSRDRIFVCSAKASAERDHGRSATPSANRYDGRSAKASAERGR
jgi:hypothetical protein